MATIQTVQPGAAAPGRLIINANFTALNAELGAAETPAGAQAKANAAQAAAIAASADSLASHLSASDPHGDRAASDPVGTAAAAVASHTASTDPHGDRAFAVDRDHHSGTQAASTVVEDSTHRFATDAEKSAWSAKQNALTNAATLAKITEYAGAPLWNGSAWPGGGGGSYGREFLTAARTYYVSGTGSDLNNGLTAGSPFLTIQRAVNIIAGTLDLGGQAVTIQCSDSTFGAGATCATAWTGGTDVTLLGNPANPAACIISMATGTAISTGNSTILKVSGFTLANTAGNAIAASTRSGITITGAMIYGACNYHLLAQSNGSIAIAADYTIAGSANSHMINNFGGYIGRGGNRTVTLTGTPAFATGFANCANAATINIGGYTYAGTATGSRYTVTSGGVLTTGGGTLPGNACGTCVGGVIS